MIQVTGSTTVALQTRGTSSPSACFQSKPRPSLDRDPLNYRISQIENVRRFQNAILNAVVNFSKEVEAINLLSMGGGRKKSRELELTVSRRFGNRVTSMGDLVIVKQSLSG